MPRLREYHASQNCWKVRVLLGIPYRTRPVAISPASARSNRLRGKVHR
jgi:hypothetical protein